MNFLWKLALANGVIIAAVQLGRHHPSLSGLIATMPLTTLVVMVWLYSESPGDSGRMIDYTRGVLWGMVPSVGFFVAALLCFQRNLALSWVLAASFGVWLIGALAHRWFLG